jgi:hypothetical protein
MKRRLSASLLAAALAGCAMPLNARETGDPADPQLWRTTGRTDWSDPWRTERWRGMADRLARPQPVAVYFATQEACERFRAAHSSYTKPDEVCQPVRGSVISGGQR